jgi:tetratricopeptide (TPR) repeat protein
MRVRHAEHPTVVQLGQRLRQAVARPPEAVSQVPSATVQEIEASVRSAAPPAAPEPPAAAALDEAPLEGVAVKFSVTDTAATPAGGFVDLGAELEEEMAAAEQQGGAHAGTVPLVDGLIREFQKGVREQLDEKDFETHYNLGIAYKEMELYDEAIQEFQLTARDPARLLECADLVGLCYLAKGQPDQAVRSLSAGLEVEGYPPASYHSLHYDLGIAYEALGDLEKSLDQFELLQQQGAQFRDVQVRVQGLRARLPKAKGATPPDGPKTPKKKKISFI